MFIVNEYNLSFVQYAKEYLDQKLWFDLQKQVIEVIVFKLKALIIEVVFELKYGKVRRFVLKVVYQLNAEI